MLPFLYDTRAQSGRSEAVTLMQHIDVLILRKVRMSLHLFLQPTCSEGALPSCPA